MKISFCTTCKNRLWQLAKTMPSNIKTILGVDDVEIVLLNYHSEDQLEHYILANFNSELQSGKLKYFKLINERPYFDMSYAKNVVHRLATGQVLFNLDADNYIGAVIPELRKLLEHQLLLPKYVPGTDTARMGRIGLHKSAFNRLRGYNESIQGLANDDGELICRAFSQGFRPIMSLDASIPVSNSTQEKYLFSDPQGNKAVYNTGKSIVNIQGYGKAIVGDLNGNTITLGFN